MKTEGNAVAGGTYTDTAPNLPRAGENLGHGHRPWCVDCKRKHDPDHLDDDQRCEKCARAAVSRAAAAERRAADPEAQRIWDEAAKGPKATRRPSAPTAPKRPVRSNTDGRPGPRAHFDVDEAMRRYAAGDPATQIAADLGVSTTSIYNHASRRGITAGQDKPAPVTTLQEDLERLEETDVEVAAAAHDLDDAVERLTHPADHIQPPAGLSGDLEQLIDILTETRARHDRELASIEDALRRLHEQLAPAPAGPQPVDPPAGFVVHQRRRAPRSNATPVDEQQLIAAYQAGATPPQLATEYGIGAKRVRAILDRHGIERRDDRAGHSGGQNKIITDEPALRDEVVRRYTAGESTVAIAADHDCSAKLINSVLRRAGVDLRPQAHVGRTITLDDVADIRTAYTGGEALMTIAKRLGLKKGRVRQVLVDHGVEIRPRGGLAQTTNAQRLVDLGVTAHDIKVWARDTGLTDEIAPGRVPGHLIDAYTAAHAKNTTTGDAA